MYRFAPLVFVAAASSVVTLALTDTPPSDAIWIVLTSATLCTCLWVCISYVVETQFRSSINLAVMQRGVCPSCRVFNALQEVTSPEDIHDDVRRVDCLSCETRYKVERKGDKVTATCLGKACDPE